MDEIHYILINYMVVPVMICMKTTHYICKDTFKYFSKYNYYPTINIWLVQLVV